MQEPQPLKKANNGLLRVLEHQASHGTQEEAEDPKSHDLIPGHVGVSCTAG